MESTAELFSDPISLLTGKSTGKFSILARISSEEFLYRLEFPGVLSLLSELGVAWNYHARIRERHFPDMVHVSGITQKPTSVADARTRLSPDTSATGADNRLHGYQAAI